MKILIIITDRAYIRNYFDTKIIDFLKNKFSLKFLKRENINFENSENYDFKNYEIDTKQKIKTSFFDLLINFENHKSSYFKFRLRRFYRFDLKYLGELCIDNNQKANLFNKFIKIHLILRNFIIFLFLSLLSNKFLFPTVRLIFDRFVKINPSLERQILQSNCDSLLIPTNGYSAEIYDILKMSKKHKIKVNFLIDNWDNLSSKMIFFEQPDKIFVWGQQTLLHANKIHNIPENKIFKIGSARYQNFFNQRNRNLKNNFSFKYILFLGSSWAWDEESTLDKIDKIIDNNPIIFNDTKIVYRYHPFRQRKNKLNSKWKNIVVDPQLEYSSNLGKRNWPDINYYPSLIQNCEFAIGGFTTMLLETTIFYKKFIAVGYDDGKSLLNQKNALKHFEHLEGVEKLPNLEICYNKDKLEDIIIKTTKSLNINQKHSIDKARDYFLSYDPNKSYVDKLVEGLQK